MDSVGVRRILLVDSDSRAAGEVGRILGRGYEVLGCPSCEAARTFLRARADDCALRQEGATVAVLDDSGKSRLTVSAPEAYDASGARVVASLRILGSRIQLSVEAQGLVLVDPLWELTGSMNPARYQHTLTRLNDGKFLVTGGRNSWPTGTTPVFDPATGAWFNAAALLAPRFSHTATLLADGSVLVAGGTADGSYYSPPLASAELWYPSRRGRILARYGS